MPHIAAILIAHAMLGQYKPGSIVEAMLKLSAGDVPAIDAVAQSDNGAVGITGISDVPLPEPLLTDSKDLLVGLCGESEDEGPSNTWAPRLASNYKNIGHKALQNPVGPLQRVLIDLTDQCIHAATDHFGLAFVYYLGTDKFVAVSSTLRSFLALPWLQPKLTEESIADILNFGFIMGEETILEGVRLLPPGKSCQGKIGKPFQQQTYWQPDFRSDLSKRSDLIQEYQSAFTNTIVSQSRQFLGQRWGVSLSGGYDSRICVGSFLKLFPDTKPTAITYGSSKTNECIRAKEVAKELGLVDHIIQPIQYSSLAHYYPKALWHTDGMANIQDCYLASQFSEFHHKMNIRLDGFLGDAHWGGSYLHESILDAQKYEDVFPWICKKLGFLTHPIVKLLKPTLREKIVSIGNERIRKIWDEFDTDMPATGRTEWLLYLTRGRRHIYQHHGNLFQGTLYSIRPFMGLPCMEICFKTPPHERIHHGIYKEWMNTYYPNIARIGIPSNGLEEDNFLYRLLNWCSYGLLPIYDSRSVQPNGWAFSIKFRKDVIKFIRLYEEYLHEYVDRTALNHFLRIAPGRSWAFSVLGPLMQIVINQLLFIVRDKVFWW